MTVYTLLARHYDALFEGTASWGAAARDRMLGAILPHVGSACDLACGTGTTALELARTGIRVFAVDLSPTMCELARKKARRARLPVEIIEADMRRFRLPEPVDLVTCEFDAINHVPRKADLPLVARAVARALRPGGWFYFDANNRLAFEKIWPVTWFTEKPGLLLLMRGGYDRRRDKAFADAHVFVQKGRLWERGHERIEQVCWTSAEIRAVLSDAGFDRVRARDAAPFFKGNPLYRRGYRTFWLARKTA
ncbi:MAG TPA: class I SAM-dependent methyltransferase [Bryobacteraceae bacterium]|nr:class I SAM-dependent methyltransferase [Bryobacteraceae bacterium]